MLDVGYCQITVKTARSQTHNLKAPKMRASVQAVGHLCCCCLLDCAKQRRCNSKNKTKSVCQTVQLNHSTTLRLQGLFDRVMCVFICHGI